MSVSNLKKHIVILLLIFPAFVLKSQGNKVLSTFIADSAFRHAQISFSLKEVATGKSLFDYHPQRTCVPASVTKLVTTATALEILGPNYRFTTTLQTDGFIDSTGCLQGNLFIVGNGDPTLGTKHFVDSNFIDVWLSRLKRIGINRIEGSIISDASLYDTDPIPALWLREDLGSYYGAGVFPISVFDNTMVLTLQSAQKGAVPEIISSFPDVGYQYENNLLTKACRKDSVYMIGEPYSLKRVLTGAVRENQPQIKVKGDIADPPLFLAQYLLQRLHEADIIVQGEAAVSYTRPLMNREVLYTHHSPTVAQIIKVTNVLSNNNYAEHLLKHLALQRDSVATFATGMNVLQTFWKGKGFDTSGLFMYDGSGLTPKNGMYSAFVSDLLVYMRKKSKHSGNYYASLPIAGETGTVSQFLRNTDLRGKVRVKTGSFRNVQCYAGYITKDDKEYAFCIMLNNFTGERRRVVQLTERLLVNLYPHLNN